MKVNAKEFGAFLMGLGKFVHLKGDSQGKLPDLVDALEEGDTDNAVVVCVLNTMSENGIDEDRLRIVEDCAIACRGLEDIYSEQDEFGSGESDADSDEDVSGFSNGSSDDPWPDPETCPLPDSDED
jgi:hypothetical protein